MYHRAHIRNGDLFAGLDVPLSMNGQLFNAGVPMPVTIAIAGVIDSCSLQEKFQLCPTYLLSESCWS